MIRIMIGHLPNTILNLLRRPLIWNSAGKSLVNHHKVDIGWEIKEKQEWSSLESNSCENSDEIEMFFGHLVIDKWVLSSSGPGQVQVGSRSAS